MNDLEVRGLSHAMATIVREFFEIESAKLRASFEQFVATRIAELPAGPKGDRGESIKGEPGKDADPDLILSLVESAVAAIPKPHDGKNADPVDTAAIVAEVVRQIPIPEPGKNGKDAVVDVDAIVGRVLERVHN